MAAVDRRLGVVRRGVTPAAPKPINLPSQKLENNQLIPDVEIVPRGTCCWGNAGRPMYATGESNDCTDVASSPLAPDGLEDLASKVESSLVVADEVQGPVIKSNLPLSVERSKVPVPLTSCVVSVDPLVACPSLRDSNSTSDAGSDSPASETGRFADNVARPSSSGSGSSSAASPTVMVQEQRSTEETSETFETHSGDDVKVANTKDKQEIHMVNESQQGSQDFGYFEGFYNTHPHFPRSGMPYPSSPGMAFRTGIHAEPPQHYSFLGVPYYDSVNDKEIVVITMVGSPGYQGSYLPYPGFPDQYIRPVYGNFPLQFGHFEHFVGPQATLEMNCTDSNEDFGFVSYEHDNIKQSFSSRRQANMMQRNNGMCFPTSLSTCELNPMSEDRSMPRQTGRQKSIIRNKRAATRDPLIAGFTPERRVTLLTKVSQHEVIITNVQRKRGGVRQARSSLAPYSSAQEEEPVQDGMKIPVCAPQIESVSPCIEASVALTDRFPALESSDNAAVASDSLKVNGSGAPDDIGSLAHEPSSGNDLCRKANIKDSSCLSICIKDAKPAICEPSLTYLSNSGTASATSSAPITRFLEGQSPLGVRQGPSPSVYSKKNCQLVVASMDKASVPEDNSSEVKCERKIGASDVESLCQVFVEPAAPVELASEHVTDFDTFSDSTVASLSNEHVRESIQGIATRKLNKQWRRKVSVDVSKQEPEDSNQKIQDLADDMLILSQESCSDVLKDGSSTAATEYLPLSPGEVNCESEGSVFLFSETQTALNACNGPGSSSTKEHSVVSQVDAASNGGFMKKKCKIGSRPGASGGNIEWTPKLCPGQALDNCLKSAPLGGIQVSQSLTVTSGSQKKWRPKLCGDVGKKNFVTKVNTSTVLTTSKECSSQVLHEGLVSNCDSTHMVEEDTKKPHIGVDSFVPKASFDHQSGDEKCNRQLSCSESAIADAAENGNSKLAHVGQEQHSLEESPGMKTSSVIFHERSKGMSSGDSSSRNVYTRKQGHAWKMVQKQLPEMKVCVVSKPEVPELKNSVYAVQGAPRVSWKPKKSTTVYIFKEGSFEGTGNPSNVVQKKRQ